ncbi:hypothetical protein Rhe02_03490 [Rhizocola hellebori]|uniref:Uncharacterized protein n=1 Tax=Rhizocola hellebori TaxID=1392758 RepID=A0A8J3Q2L6_9ACTN|nr:hypothetical protein Rhe02_03490 [Rhizocola hellebori]
MVLPASYTKFDEWYNYRTNPRSTARVLATLNESLLLRRHDERRSPHHLVQGIRGRPVVLHRNGPHSSDLFTYATVTTTLTGVPAGTANVYLTFAGTGSLFDVDDFTFVKQ